MCGILAILDQKRILSSEKLTSASSVIRHRGPDDEGFLTWMPGDEPRVWAGSDTADSTIKHWSYSRLGGDMKFSVGFGHRRLSILDLSPSGHQPMLYQKAGLAITFNGEVYNYLEIKAELEQKGHRFHTTSDTEVILHAWDEWGVKCLDKFNGMFAFVILDHIKRKLYAVRDRFGVKPLYYYNKNGVIYLASEIKQIKTAPGFQFHINDGVAADFLANGQCEYDGQTFYADIHQLRAGHYMYVDLSGESYGLVIDKWYELTPKKWSGSYEDAAGRLKELLTDAVRLRLRSDVKVGSCLSGGLDSSSIVCIVAELLKTKGDFAGQETVTACFESAKYDEWKFAQEVIRKTEAHAHRVFPSFQQLMDEYDRFMWHQDEPVGSTSIFSQWAVFKGTHAAGLKVMIDGQGADEQLAGYGGNDIALYTGLLKNAKFSLLLEEAKQYKKENGSWPKGYLLAALQLSTNGRASALLPGKLRISDTMPGIEWMRGQHVRPNKPASSLQENLMRQLYMDPLPALLRYEDHNSMAWSVESRTPFMDYRLLEFNLGLPETFVYKGGVRKRILRDAMKGVLPQAIQDRKDKMGFVTPEELWMKGEGRKWFTDEINTAAEQLQQYVLPDKVCRYLAEMMEGTTSFDFTPWRIICFNKWLQGH